MVESKNNKAVQITTAKEAHARLAAGRAELQSMFKEREPEIRGLLVAALAGEHPLLLGPPGTGKSALVNAFSELLGLDTFSLLLTKFTTPEEVFGPVDIQAMKKGSYRRRVNGRAWDTPVVFLDEIFKASSSILNSLLTLMQERVADNDGRVPAPLEILIGASNEYPADASLDAMFDRFSCRFWVDYIGQQKNMRDLLLAGGTGGLTVKLGAQDLEMLRDAVKAVPFNDREVDLLLSVKAAVQDAGFAPSDRTWVKAIRLLQASAVLDGRDTIATSDFRFLADVLWKKHDERPKLLSIIGNAADPYGARSEAIIDGIAIAMRELPSWLLVESGQMSKVKAQEIMVGVNNKIMKEVDKIGKLEDEAEGHPDVVTVRTRAKAAIKVFDEFNEKLLWHRG